MRFLQHTTLLLTLGFLFAFKPSPTCQYSSSNIDFVKSEIEQALAMTEIQMTRFHTYKAINAIEKSKKNLEDCGCKNAIEHITEGSEQLKLATKTNGMASTAILLDRALDETQATLNALHDHESHGSIYGNDVLELNTVNLRTKKNNEYQPPSNQFVRRKIDSSLVSYKKSLDMVVASVNCKEAMEYVEKVFEHCEQELLKPELSESKKYYNWRTKEITAEAIEQLRDCNRRYN